MTSLASELISRSIASGRVETLRNGWTRELASALFDRSEWHDEQRGDDCAVENWYGECAATGKPWHVRLVDSY